MICFGKEVRFAQQCFSNVVNLELCDTGLVAYVMLKLQIISVQIHARTVKEK